MTDRPPGAADSSAQASDMPPLLSRITRREQELEAALAACRAKGEARIASAREEAARIMEKSRIDADEKYRLLITGAEKNARSEADRIIRHSLSRAESIISDGSCRAAAAIDELLETLLPGGKRGGCK